VAGAGEAGAGAPNREVEAEAVEAGDEAPGSEAGALRTRMASRPAWRSERGGQGLVRVHCRRTGVSFCNHWWYARIFVCLAYYTSLMADH